MTALDLVPPSDQILHNPTLRYDFDFPQIPLDELLETLADSFKKHGGLALSANQIGLPWSVFIYGTHKDPSTYKYVFNPKIVAQGDIREAEEGCLSYPGLILKVERPFTLDIRYANQFGVYRTDLVRNLTAHVFSHETDHLNGITFGQKISKFQLRRQIERFNKSKKSAKLVVGDFYPKSLEL